jgi:hypothetical protein
MMVPWLSIVMLPTIRHLTVLVLILGACCARANADGGQIRASRQDGEYVVTVFTSPTPLRAGPIDVSVLVQNANDGTAVTDAMVTVSLTTSDPLLPPIRAAATNAAATNKLLQAAAVDLPAAGVWQVDVECALPNESPLAIAFQVDAAPPLPAWLSVWPWFSWPAVVVLLFALHRWRVARRQTTVRSKHRQSARRSDEIPTHSPTVATA